jgi:hypothetical protein
MTDATEITNMAGRTLRLGQTVTHWDGWTGKIVRINEDRGLVFVEPDDLSKLPRRYCYPLNDASRAQTGRAEFCRPRDHGLSMGNYREACPDADDVEEANPSVEGY